MSHLETCLLKSESVPLQESLIVIANFGSFRASFKLFFCKFQHSLQRMRWYTIVVLLAVRYLSAPYSNKGLYRYCKFQKVVSLLNFSSLSAEFFFMYNRLSENFFVINN